MASPLHLSSTTLSDVLGSNLSYSAYQGLVDILRSDGGLASARLAFRALRDAIDANVPELRLRLASPGLASLCDGGRWLQRFSSVRKLVLELPAVADGIDTNPALCLAPFLGASPESLRRIRELSVPPIPLPAHVLLWLLLNLPELQKLELLGPAQPEHVLAWGGLPALPRLSTLVLVHWNWILCMDSRFAPSLKLLTLGGAQRRRQPWPSPADVAAAVARLGGLEEVHLGEGYRFTAPHLRLILDALPPTVRQCTVQQVLLYVDAEESVSLCCDLEGGQLVSFSLTSPEGYGLLADSATSFLEEALLPCNKLGPRLPHLHLGVELRAYQDCSPEVEALLARCDEVRVRGIEATDGLSAWHIARVFGAAPDELWFDLSNNEFVGLRLRGAANGGCVGGGGNRNSSGIGTGSNSGGGGGSSGGAGSGGQGSRGVGADASEGFGNRGAANSGVPAEDRLVNMAGVMRKAAQWFAALESLVRSMFAFSGALGAAEASSQAPEQQDEKLAAVEEAWASLTWDPNARIRTMIWDRFPLQHMPAAADLVEQMEIEARQNAGFGGAPSPTAFLAVAFMPFRVQTGFALAQVLQALWDGREAGAPGLDRGELVRLEWLLGVLQEVRVVVAGMGSAGLSYAAFE
ncbi:hypothetical protein HYH03_016157 [Edaphochlamys debaryana]|uniref:Uncharacterized protein n=1 Tax=Edaphochlamys debaryana TaxID=47281 RepID=A0A835XQB6_9CHLO|nr:hypothetical protein HYH03_016157 [Edaphochlamys debaryana]|eukprot:KAG2485060.1 hypothetical protein HYH03_016157 [Edaphochlamys debaryana]